MVTPGPIRISRKQSHSSTAQADGNSKKSSRHAQLSHAGQLGLIRKGGGEIKSAILRIPSMTPLPTIAPGGRRDRIAKR